MVLQRPGSVPTADLTVVAITGGGPGNRNDPVHYRGSDLEFLCQTHGRVYADGGYRGITELQTPVFDGQHIRRDDAWRRHRRKRARAEHTIARLKDWQVLRNHRRRGKPLPDTLAAAAYLHNLRTTLRDISEGSSGGWAAGRSRVGGPRAGSELVDGDHALSGAETRGALTR